MDKPQPPAGKPKQYAFYTAREYWAALRRRLDDTRSGDNVLLMSMTFEPTEPAVADIMDALLAALQRGVFVTLAVDAHSFLVDGRRIGPLWAQKDIGSRSWKVFRNKLALLSGIESQPTGRVVILNKPSRRFSLPVAGRSHIKAALINDFIFLGGCNLQGSHYVDLMIGWRDSQAATWLTDTMSRLIENGHTRQAFGSDQAYQVDTSTSIFIDSGARNQSLIFDEALALIDSAERWLTITCQFFPNGVTAAHLLAAQRRGVRIEIIFAHPRHHGVIGGLGQQVSILRERSRLPRTLFEHALRRSDPMLHAKLIACDQGVMIGSHNYVSAGVMLGTAEIALLERNEARAREAVQAVKRELKLAF